MVACICDCVVLFSLRVAVGDDCWLSWFCCFAWCVVIQVCCVCLVLWILGLDLFVWCFDFIVQLRLAGFWFRVGAI